MEVSQILSISGDTSLGSALQMKNVSNKHHGPVFDTTDSDSAKEFLNINMSRDDERLLKSEEIYSPSIGKRMQNPESTSPTNSKRRKVNAELLPETDGYWDCKWENCKERFISLTKLGKHLTDHIKQQKTENRSNKKSGYVCKWEKCQRNTPFKGCYNLEHHLRYQHTGEKPFRCKYCQSNFAQRSDLSEHLYKIHNRMTGSRRGKNKNMQAGQYQYPDSVDKIHQITMPRSGPIPILPAPQVPSPYLEYSPFVLGSLRQSMPGTDGMLFSMPRFSTTIEPETFPSQQVEPAQDVNMIPPFGFFHRPEHLGYNYPYGPGLMQFSHCTPRNSTSNLYTDYHEQSLDTPTVFSMFSSQQSWENQPDEKDSDD